MQTELKKLKRLKLLTPTPAFTEGIAAARQANQQGHTKHLFHERLAFSLLAYRSRKKLTVSLREVCRETTLHPRTASAAIDNLVGLVQKQGGKWTAEEPPQGWFRNRPTDQPVEHWWDHLAYTTLLFPRQGAKILCADKTKRFTLNHAAVYSFILSRAKNTGVVRRFTVAGQATMLGVNPKTVATVVDDLESLGLIQREDLGRCSDITLLPMTPEHLTLFEPVREQKKAVKDVKPTASKPKVEAYVLKGGGWDDWRKLCVRLMPQSYAETAIKISHRLGDDYYYFEEQLKAAKAQHEQNIIDGKVGPGNFGSYFNKRLQTRLDKVEEQQRREEAEERLDKYLASPEYKAKKAEEEKAAAADPLHDRHILSRESLTDRVQFSDNILENLHAADKIMSQVYRHAENHYWPKIQDIQKRIDMTKELQVNILSHALKMLNHYYKKPVRATPDELKQAIDDVIRKNCSRIGLLYNRPTTKPEVTNA